MSLIEMDNEYSVAREVVRAVKDLGTVKEEEKTKRKAVKATLKIALAQLSANRELVIQDLKNKHQERMELYQAGKDIIKLGIQDNDIEIVKLGKNLLVETYGSPSLGVEDKNQIQRVAFKELVG